MVTERKIPTTPTPDGLKQLRALGYNRAPRSKLPVMRSSTQDVLQALSHSGSLADLLQQNHNSQQCLKAIDGVLAPGLRANVYAGSLENGTWCLLTVSNSAAAKLRQLTPSLAAHLRVKGWNIQSIKVKLIIGNPRTSDPK